MVKMEVAKFSSFTGTDAFYYKGSACRFKRSGFYDYWSSTTINECYKGNYLSESHK